MQFIPRSKKKRRDTPDLKAVLGSTPVLCEVKTINHSDAEAAAKKQGTGRDIQETLPNQFFEKLTNTLIKARQEMTRYCSGDETKNFVYVVINFDDRLHEYVETYSKQLDAYKNSEPVPGIEIVFHYKPPFYSATA